jgi:hypothetical protein
VAFKPSAAVVHAHGVEGLSGNGPRELPLIVLHCRVARVRQESDLSTLLGAEFLRLMIPCADTTVDPQAMAGLLIDALLWTDVFKETPADPFSLLDPAP